MGQYYHVITEDKNGNREYYDMQSRKFYDSEKAGSPDYKEYNGLKLMEHSYWENPLCEAVALRLVDTPKRVCWVGDYAGAGECKELGFTYDEVWDCPDGKYQHYEETKFKMKSVKYLVNNSTRTYVDLKEYFAKSNEKIEYKGKLYDHCIFPISLLTAVGNGGGGGDYFSKVCADKVGSWAFDEIYLTNDLPEGYEKEDVYFKE